MHVVQQNPCVFNGNTILVIDVGGGTTDVVKFQAQFQLDGTLLFHNLEPIQKIIGFSAVEKEWEDHVYRTLLALPRFQSQEKHSPGVVRQVARGLRRSEWFRNRVQSTDPESGELSLSLIKEISEVLPNLGNDSTIPIME